MRKWVVVAALMMLSTVSVSSYAQEPQAGNRRIEGDALVQQLGIK